MHAGCFSVSIIHQTPPWTTVSDVNARDCTWRCTDTHVTESALKVDSGRRIPCRTRESNPASVAFQCSALPTELHPHGIKLFLTCARSSRSQNVWPGLRPNACLLTHLMRWISMHQLGQLNGVGWWKGQNSQWAVFSRGVPSPRS